MLLSDKEIKYRRLVENRIEDHFRAASYDLSVGTIISVEGKEEEGEFWLKPQGIVEIISREKVKLPKDVVGIAMVKTGLCNEGILALNIGIIDPGYEGYLSTTLLNFGKKKFLLRINDVFLRLTFLECYISISPRSERPSPVAYKDYVGDKKKKVTNFSETFLNLEETVKTASGPLFDDIKKNLLIWVPVGAFALTLFAFFVTIGVNYTSRNIWSREQLKAELLEDVENRKSTILETRIKDIEERNSAALETRIKELDLQLQKLSFNQAIPVLEARIKELELQLQKLSVNRATSDGRGGNPNAAGRGNRPGR